MVQLVVKRESQVAVSMLPGWLQLEEILKGLLRVPKLRCTTAQLKRRERTSKISTKTRQQGRCSVCSGLFEVKVAPGRPSSVWFSSAVSGELTEGVGWSSDTKPAHSAILGSSSVDASHIFPDTHCARGTSCQ